MFRIPNIRVTLPSRNFPLRQSCPSPCSSISAHRHRHLSKKAITCTSAKSSAASTAVSPARFTQAFRVPSRISKCAHRIPVTAKPRISSSKTIFKTSFTRISRPVPHRSKKPRPIPSSKSSKTPVSPVWAARRSQPMPRFSQLSAKQGKLSSTAPSANRISPLTTA